MGKGDSGDSLMQTPAANDNPALQHEEQTVGAEEKYKHSPIGDINSYWDGTSSGMRIRPRSMVESRCSLDGVA